MSFDYSSIPPGYYFEAMMSGAKPQQFWHLNKFKEVVSEIPLVAKKLLDVGCAAGSLSYVVSTMRPDIECVGVDISPQQVEYAIGRVLPLCRNADFAICDAGKLNFPDHTFDVVTTVELIEHLSADEILNLTSEIRRVLVPGGVWIITTPNYKSLWPVVEIALNLLSPIKYNEQHISKFNPKKLQQFLDHGGFIVKNCRSIFTAAPFLTWIAVPIAMKIFEWEKQLKLPGNLLVATAVSEVPQLEFAES